MQNFTKIAIAVILLILVGSVGYYFVKGGKPVSQPAVQEQQPGQQPPQMATSTYATSTFSVVYPQDFTVDESYANTSVNPKKPIHGVKFTIPMDMATGTNLSPDTYISIESLPHAKKCTGDIYISANVHPTDLNDSNGVVYSVATTTGAAAGNIYEELVYAIADSNPCIAVRYYIHSGNIDNYPAGSVQEFDHQKLIDAFDTIRHAITVTPAPATP